MELFPPTLLSSVRMDVFVIPVGRDRYELYCEQPEEPVSADTGPPKGMIEKLRHRISTMLHAAEERRHGRAEPDGEKGWMARTHDRMMSWVVERIAEQRLLWNLRQHTGVVAVHPQDMTSDQVMTLIRRMLQRDRDRHRRWMIIDGILFLVTFVLLGPLFLLVPGVANLPALYFGFRTVGHFLSMRGAQQGLSRVQWTTRESPPLGELRDVILLEPHMRDERVHDIASRLRLPHLPSFFDRVAVPQG
jgi:hypothetical protein